MAFEHEHHPVAAAYAETLEPRCGAVGQFLEFAESETAFGTLVVGPQQGFALRFFRRPCVHNIVSEIEAVRHVHMETLAEILIPRKFSPVKKFFNHKPMQIIKLQTSVEAAMSDLSRCAADC